MFAKAIRDALRRAGKSQEWLARQLEVSPPAVSKWCRGESVPYDRNLVALLDVLSPYGLSPADFDRDDVMPALAAAGRGMQPEERIIEATLPSDPEKLYRLLAEESITVAEHRQNEREAKEKAEASEARIKEILSKLEDAK